MLVVILCLRLMNNEKINIEAVFQKLWSCRDLEIQHYWHRMVFMTAFMVLSFASYGGLIAALIGSDKIPPFALTNAGCFLMSLVGIVVALFWIMMSKGSKAWQEEYEFVITAFVKKYSELLDCDKEYAGHKYEELEEIEPAKINDFIWSTKAGRYSVSKVGIAIGHLALLVWSIIGGVHLYLIRFFNSWEGAAVCMERMISWNNLFYGGVIFLLLFWLYAKVFLFSGYFKKRRVER